MAIAEREGLEAEALGDEGRHDRRARGHVRSGLERIARVAAKAAGDVREATAG